jgi:hypothetical protein
MKKSLRKIIVIVAFGIGAISFNTIKASSTDKISKCINFLSSNSQGGLVINYK